MSSDEDLTACSGCSQWFAAIEHDHRVDSLCRSPDELRADGWSIRPDGVWTRMVQGKYAYTAPNGHRVFRT